MKKEYADVQGMKNEKLTDLQKTTANKEIGTFDVNDAVRKQLNEAVDNSGMTDMELQRRTKIASSTIRRMLNGDIKSPTLEKVVSLYAALGLSLPLPEAIATPYKRSRTSPPQPLTSRPQHTFGDLVEKGAQLLSYPAPPNETHKRQAEIFVRGLVLSEVVTVKGNLPY